MAIHAHSTTAPVVQTGLLPRRDACGRLRKPGLPPEPLLAADTPEAVRSDIEALLADHGRGIHFKRALHEAFDFGFALLDALDLPPLALDVIDDAIATLDALDAPDEDREPWLAGVCDLAFVPGVPRSTPRTTPRKTRAPRSRAIGRGFVRAGADDAEEDDEPERDDECGSDDGEDIGHHASQFRPFPLTHAERAEVVVMAARAAQVRRTMHV